MDFPKDFKIQAPCVPVTSTKPILTKRSPVSGSDWLGSVDVLAGRNGGPGIWTQAAAAALASVSKQTQTCTQSGREVRTPAFDHPMQMSYSTLLSLSDPAIMTDMTNLAPLLLARIAPSHSGSQMMPAASPSQNHFLLNSSQIAASHSCSDMIPAASPNENHFLLNGSSVPTSSASNSSNRPLRPLVPKSQYLLPTLLPNLNSISENNRSNTVLNKSVVSPVTPAKLGPNMKMQDCQPVEIIDLVDDTLTSQSIQMNEFGKVQQPTEEEAQLSFSTPGVPSCSVSLQQQEGEVNTISPTENSLQQAEGENQGIDLNKIPREKPKRKKHIPKVIRERKQAKAPKPVTPKPVTPRCAKKTENPPQDKKKDLVSKENPSDTLGDVVNPQSESGSKSLRHNSLNFDSEDCQARDVTPGSEMMSTSNVDSHAVIAGSTAKSDMQSVQGWDSSVFENLHAAIAYSGKSDMQSVQGRIVRVLENPQFATANSSAKSDMQSVQVRGSRMLENSLSDRGSFDLNSSVNHFDAEYLRIPQTPNPPSQPSRQEMMRTIKMQDEYIRMLNNMMLSPQPARREGQNLKKLARKNSYLNVVRNRDISLEAGQNQVASDNISEALLKGTKRDRTLADDAQVLGSFSLIHAYNRINSGTESCDTSRNGNCSPEIYKKKRTNTQNEVPSAYSTFTSTSSSWKTVQAAQNTSKAFAFANAQRFMAYEKFRAWNHMLVTEQSERTANNGPLQDQSPPSLNAGVSNQWASTTLTPPGHNSATCRPSTPEKSSGFTYNPDQSSPSPNTGVGNQGASTPVSSLSNNSAGCQPSTPEKPSGHTHNQDNTSIGPQARNEAVIASKKLKSKGRRGRKKEQVPLNPMSSNAKRLGIENEAAASTTVPSHGQESPSKCPSTKKSAQSTSRKDSHLHRSSVRDFQSSSNYKRSPVSGSDWLGSADVLAGRNGGLGSSWDPGSWSQATAAALASASQQTQTCTHSGREMRTPAFDHPMQMSYRTLLALSDPAAMSDMTKLAPLLLSQIAYSHNG